MAGVLEEISQWASKLPYWEQAALERIVAGTALTEDDYAELLRYLLEDAGLAEREPTPRPTLTFPQLAEAGTLATGTACRLSKISGLQNINALAPNQELTFGPNLTVVFGANGSGKSGYARVIASAAFTRGDKQVLPDIGQAADDAAVMSAVFELTDGTSSHTLTYTIGQPCPDMRCFYVFDSTSVEAHLTRSNAMSFSPGGLGYLTQLAVVTDQVRQRLQSQVEKRTRDNPYVSLFPEDTEVRQQIVTLGAKTDLEALRKLGTFSPDDEEALKKLDLRIAQLKTEEVPEKIANLEQIIGDLEKLSERLQAIEQELAEERQAEIRTHVVEWQARSLLAHSLSVESFAIDGLRQTGSEVWGAFIEAAHTLAQAESAPDRPYPQADSRCLLCHQPLADEAVGLIRRLWTFLESDARSRLEETEQALAKHRQTVDQLDLAFFDEQAVSYRHLEDKDPDLHKQVLAYLETCKEYAGALAGSIDAHSEPALPAPPSSPRSGVEDVIQRVTSEKEELENRNVAEEIARLQAQLVQLQHRQRLAQQLDEIEKYVADCVWVVKASAAKVKRSTAHITMKYNELFDRLVTQQYLKLFEQLLGELNCPRQVKVQTRAEKGRTVKQIALQTHETVTAAKAPPEKVLSEGEQRAVALADFLTEVILDENSTGVILDDPVSSLDFDWKETIAGHVVGQAQKRQVVVFTHDLHFLYCLKEYAERSDVSVEGHWIQKLDGKPGWVFLGNCPLSESDYKKTGRVQQIQQQAKKPGLAPAEQQRLLQEGFGALRTCYEAFVMFDLFGGTVQRFDEQIRIQNLRIVAFDRAMVQEVMDKVALLSRYIEGHLHSDQYVAQKPTPEILQREIEALDALRQRHKSYKKSLGIKD